MCFFFTKGTALKEKYLLPREQMLPIKGSPRFGSDPNLTLRKRNCVLAMPLKFCDAAALFVSQYRVH